MSSSPDRGDVLLLSCYDLGRQPVGVATTAAFLERAGVRTHVADLSVDALDSISGDVLRRIGLAVVSAPMHTALRLGVRAAEKFRLACPDAAVCFTGPYAELNRRFLIDSGIADHVLGGESDPALVELVTGEVLPRRPDYPVPRRDDLPPLDRYAKLEHGGTTRLAAAVETTRGCLHTCRHCPLPAVYDGRLFVIPADVVVQDVRNVVAAGATHVTFADPDFLNGPRHAERIVDRVHREFPRLTFDFTAKIEHLVRHHDRLHRFAERGCLFVVSAVESLDDDVLRHLDKGHTGADVRSVARQLADAGIALRPTLVPFTPWETVTGYGRILEWVADAGLVNHVDVVQWSIRLLVPPGSLLATYPEFTRHASGTDEAGFQVRWVHPDPTMDRLHARVDRIVRDAATSGADPRATFAAIRDAHGAEGGVVTITPPRAARSRPPRITEPWFC